MARKKTPSKEESEREVSDVTDSDEEEDDIEESNIIDDSESLDYPVFSRRVNPSLRINPITEPLEDELADIQIPGRRDEEDTPQNQDKNYSISQKYELPGSSAYESITPQTITAPSKSISPSINPNFQDQLNPASPFRASDTSSNTYPGGDDKKYDSGLEHQSQQSEQERRRRTF